MSDLDELALALPQVTKEVSDDGRPSYLVHGKRFVLQRSRRPDAVDPETGERYPDVIVIWVASEADKLALVQDPSTPYFTTPHFDGHPSVLVRACELGRVSREELAELIEDAWLSRASRTRAARYLTEHPAG